MSNFQYLTHKLSFLYAGLIIILIPSCSNQQAKSRNAVEAQAIQEDFTLQVDFDYQHYLDMAAEQVKTTVPSVPSQRYPRTFEDEKLVTVKPRDWTSGFFPGNLWFLFEDTGLDFWKEKAINWTKGLESQKNNNRTHDTGFMMYCSYGNGYRLTRDTNYRAILLETAATLASRYNPNVGCIRSWDFNRSDTDWQFPVIIDNMMNLELIMWAFKETQDSTYYNIALNHALTTMKNHYRSDFSTWHVVDYDPGTGDIRSKGTHQGFSDDSEWARGQAWGLYGYTMMYRETEVQQFLEQALRIADYVIAKNSALSDGIPVWDYDDPDVANAPKDASAAAIAASALLELSKYADEDKRKEYFNEAVDLLTTLSNDYRVELGDKGGFILDKSTGNFRRDSEVSVPIVYADYYYLEALLRLKKYVN
ncbi:MAG: glycoside hydrolase family 88 protein [Bacteroidota bacterium]